MGPRGAGSGRPRGAGSVRVGPSRAQQGWDSLHLGYKDWKSIKLLSDSALATRIGQVAWGRRPE